MTHNYLSEPAWPNPGHQVELRCLEYTVSNLAQLKKNTLSNTRFSTQFVNSNIVFTSLNSIGIILGAILIDFEGSIIGVDCFIAQLGPIGGGFKRLDLGLAFIGFDVRLDSFLLHNISI